MVLYIQVHKKLFMLDKQELLLNTDSHYWKLNEAKRGKRTMTKLFKFLDSYLPLRVQVKLLRVVDTDKPFNDADFMEKYYINYYRKINPNLLNETNGGIGGYTAINKSDNEKSIIGRKISNAIKGRKKPKGFAEHLSAIKKVKIILWLKD